MKDFKMTKNWLNNWLLAVLALGGVFLLAVFLVKPIGVSTQFVIFDGILIDTVKTNYVTENAEAKYGYSSENAYLNEKGGKAAAAVANPMNYDFVFVLAMALGAFISAKLRGGQTALENKVPEAWRERFGSCKVKRYASVFFAGVLVLFGARLADGCTSGHMMSGMMQTSLSGYLFALAAFSTAIPTAFILFRRKGN